MAIFRGVFEATRGNMHLLRQNLDPKFMPIQNLRLCGALISIDGPTYKRTYSGEMMRLTIPRTAVLQEGTTLIEAGFVMIETICILGQDLHSDEHWVLIGRSE